MENLHEKMKAVSKTYSEVLLYNKNSFKKKSADRLLKIISTKMTTTFIGALSQFEDQFGHLWGHGKNENELSATERRNRSLWEIARNNILNNGNKQFRDLEKEVRNYEIEWKRYSVTLPFQEES